MAESERPRSPFAGKIDFSARPPVRSLSLEEIATVTGIEVGAVKARLHRAREALRRHLAPLLGPRAERRCS